MTAPGGQNYSPGNLVDGSAVFGLVKLTAPRQGELVSPCSWVEHCYAAGSQGTSGVSSRLGTQNRIFCMADAAVGDKTWLRGFWLMRPITRTGLPEGVPSPVEGQSLCVPSTTFPGCRNGRFFSHSESTRRLVLSREGLYAKPSESQAFQRHFGAPWRFPCLLKKPYWLSSSGKCCKGTTSVKIRISPLSVGKSLDLTCQILCFCKLRNTRSSVCPVCPYRQEGGVMWYIPSFSKGFQGWHST